MAVMSVEQAARDYECWPERHTQLSPSQMRRKRDLMRNRAFSFRRATLCRRAQVCQKSEPSWPRRPTVLGAGDLQVENFGSGRSCLPACVPTEESARRAKLPDCGRS
jgi:uncharacterized protein (DUF2252 family)